MSETKTIILSHEQIQRKLQRMAWEILEKNHQENTIICIGISENGSYLASAIGKILSEISDIKVKSGRIDLNKKLGFDAEITLSCETDIRDQVVVLVDDVLNSGKVMLASMLPVIERKPRKIMTAVLADRSHKAFPVKGDVVGISLATTTQEHIWFKISDEMTMSVYLT